MKRNERTLYNRLKKEVTPDTINVEIPVDYTHEGRQAIHELLTIGKGLYVTGIYWNDIMECYCIHYERAYTETAKGIKAAQEATDIDAITADMEYSDWTWTGYHKPTAAPQTADNDSTTDSTTPVIEAIENAHKSRYSARQTAPLTFAIWDNVKNAPVIETTSTGITAYMEIFGIDHIDPAPAETIPTTEAEPAPISDTATDTTAPATKTTAHPVPAKLAKEYDARTRTNRDKWQRPRLNGSGSLCNSISWRYYHGAGTPRTVSAG